MWGRTWVVKGLGMVVISKKTGVEISRRAMCRSIFRKNPIYKHSTNVRRGNPLIFHMSIATSNALASGEWLWSHSPFGSGRPFMDLKQIHYFIALFEDGSVTRPAKPLNIRQPAPSRQVSNPEAQPHQPLFDRGPHGGTP